MADNIQEEIQDKIMDLIALGAEGRLVAFKPENADRDLVVEKKGEYKKEALSLSVYENRFPDSKGLIAANNFYLMFVHFDIVKRDIADNFLLVPSLDFKKFGSKGDFSKFSTDKKHFVRFLIDTLYKK